MAEGRVGMKYDYAFFLDESIYGRYYLKHLARRTYYFELRISCKVETTEGKLVEMDGEVFEARVYHDEEIELYLMVNYRLKEYWMSQDEIKKFVVDAMAYARTIAHDPSETNRILPIAVGFKIITLQLENESLQAVKDRAMKTNFMLPLAIWPFTEDAFRDDNTPERLFYYGNLERTRVTSAEQGLEMMEVCKICNMGPFVGSQITLFPGCKHPFHSHCIIKNFFCYNKCPICRLPIEVP